MTSGPNSGLAEPSPIFLESIVARGMRVARIMIRAPYDLLCRFFDWQWERRLAAYERGLIDQMGPRERADIGLSGWNRDSTVGFWRD